MSTTPYGFIPPGVVKVRDCELAGHFKSLEGVVIDPAQRLKACRVENVPEGKDFKTVFFIRHGEGYHNVAAHAHGDEAYKSEEFADAALTEKGLAQAAAVGEHVKIHYPELAGATVYASPLQRAFTTGFLAFPQAARHVAHEGLHEEGGVHPCDRRKTPAQLRESFPQLDVSLITQDEDPTWCPENRETKQIVANRVHEFLKSDQLSLTWLVEQPEKVVGVATHSALLLTTVCCVLDCEEEARTWFDTAEVRRLAIYRD